MWKHTYDSIFFFDMWLTEDPISDFIWSLLGYILNPDKKKKTLISTVNVSIAKDV